MNHFDLIILRTKDVKIGLKFTKNYENEVPIFETVTVENIKDIIERTELYVTSGVYINCLYTKRISDDNLQELGFIYLDKYYNKYSENPKVDKWVNNKFILTKERTSKDLTLVTISKIFKQDDILFKGILSTMFDLQEVILNIENY